MSLINDALKRAKETQQQRPSTPPPGPPLRPVERPRGHGGNLWLSLAFGLVLAAAAILLWQWAQQNRKPAREAVVDFPAPAAPTETQRPAAAGPALPAEPKPASAPPVLAAQPTPQQSVSVASNVAATVAPPPVAAVTGAPPAVAEPPPKPTLKLQGIVYHPARPSVIINGKTLFLGDRIGEFRVLAIDSESVTLVGGGTTNVLSLQ